MNGGTNGRFDVSWDEREEKAKSTKKNSGDEIPRSCTRMRVSLFCSVAYHF
jgi:hypothetical protein